MRNLLFVLVLGFFAVSLGNAQNMAVLADTNNDKVFPAFAGWASGGW